MGSIPAARLTRESSLVSIQVLISASIRRISWNPAVSAACARVSLGATAVISTMVPIKTCARFAVTAVAAGWAWSGAGFGEGLEMGMITQLVRKGRQSNRTRTAPRRIGRRVYQMPECDVILL
jgi:hypothetical protein